MYKKYSMNWVKHIDFIILDMICMILAVTLAFLIRYGVLHEEKMQIYRELVVILMLINLLVSLLNESYKGILKRDIYSEFFQCFKHVTWILFLYGFYMFLAKCLAQCPRSMFIAIWLFYFALTYATRFVMKKYKRMNGQGDKHSLFVIASEDRVEEVVSSILTNNYRQFIISGICVIGKDMKGQKVCGIPVVANEDETSEYICRNWVDEVFINVAHEYEAREQILNRCMEMGVTVHCKLAKTSNSIGQKQVVENIAGYTVLSSSTNIITIKQMVVKRFVDIIGGLLGCMVTAIIFLIVGPMIYIKSPGPIFFSQWRIGKNGKLFKIYKFRSMYLDAEERKKELMEKNEVQDGFMFKMENDPRIIGGENGKGIGHFIRKTSLDEFPQFWNVLKGDMSLVGTRPPTIDEWKKYELHHRKRMSIKPGLTGMWQVSGRSQIKDFEKVVALDRKYIEEWSQALDCRILLKTFFVVLRGNGSM